MPIVVNPGYVWPPETEPVVSPDGRITAIVDPAHAGVLLRADFDDSVPDQPAQPEKVLRRNLAVNPRYGSDLSEWQDRKSSSKKVNRGDLFPAFGDWIGDDVAEVKANTSSGNYYIESTNGIPLTDQPEIAFSIPMHGTGRIWLYFNDVYGSRVSPQLQNSIVTEANGGLVTLSGKVPEGAVVAIPYLGSTVEFTETAVYYGPFMATQAESAEEAITQVQDYFDGDTPASGNKRYRWLPDGTSEEYIPGTPFIPGHDATTAKVRFERQDGSVVRSGNPAWAPGGYAHAYDHEATLGGGTLWRAVPIRFDGTEGEPSEYVGAVIPALTDGWAWLKPVTDPDKAMLLKVEPPDLSYDGRVDTTSIAGAPRPAATWDVLEGFTTQLRSLVREKDVEEQLMALLDEGPVLAQFPACAGLPDFYFIRGKLDLEHVHWDGWPWRRYQWDVIQIDRPDTTDSPLRIPGLSYDTVARDWTTYDQLKSTVESYNKLLEP